MEEPAQKKSRSEIPAGSENDGTVQSRENPVDSNIYLTYDILRIIFRCLNGRDLANAAMVCGLWLEAANNEKCTRSPHCFIQYCTVTFFFDGLNLYNGLNRIKNSRIKPSIGFFFITDHPTANIHGHIPDLLPQNCEAIMLYTSCIVINNEEIRSYALPHYKVNIVCALLPQIPNVKINTFKLTDPELCSQTLEEHSQFKLSHNPREELLNMIDQTPIPSHDKSTCLMLFCNDSGYHIAMDLASAIRSREDKITSLWGGIVNDIYTQHIDSNNPYPYEGVKHKHIPYCLAVLITGPIQTWSTVVDERYETKEEVEMRLRLFKDQVKLKKHSVGFMFACAYRGINMYGEENVESTIFKTIFSKVPLVGCFGEREFGKNTIYEMEENTKSKKKWDHEFATIFMILTYG